MEMLILQHLPLRSHLSLALPLLLSHIKVKDTMSNILLVMRVLTKANSLPRSCSCVWCVCAQVYTNIICKSRGPEPREREGDQIRLVSSSCCHVVGMEMKLEMGRPCRVLLEMVGMIQIILLC